MINKEKNIGPLTAKIAVRLHPDEKFELQANASLANLSVSELVRRQYFGYPIVPAADEMLLRELRRMGGLVKHIHNQTGGIYSQQTAQVLVEIASCLRKIEHK